MPVQSVSKKKEKSRKKHLYKKPKVNENEENQQVSSEGTACKQTVSKVSPSKREIEKQLRELKEKGRELEEQLKMQEEDTKAKKKMKHKSGSGAGTKKKGKILTKQEVEGELEEVRKTPTKKKPKKDDIYANKQTEDPMKTSILQSLKKDIIGKMKESSGSSDDDAWTTENEDLLQRHLQKFHDLMEVQPRRHTEAQIKMENQRVHEINLEKQNKELQRVRLASITNAKGTDPAKNKEEFLRKQQEKERKRNQEEINELQSVSMNKKVKSSREKRINTKVKIPVGGQGLVQKHPKKTWGTVPSEFNLNPNDDTIWPQVKPPSRFGSTGNVWSERERKQQQLQTLIPKSANEEEEMIRKALEMSKRTAEEESEFRSINSKYYTLDDDLTAELLVNRLTMESQQLAEWVQLPHNSTTGNKKPLDYNNNNRRDKSPPKSAIIPVNPPVESTKQWSKWSLMDCQTDVISNNPKEKLPAKVSSPHKKRSPIRALFKPAEEEESWNSEDADVCMDMKDAPHRCFNTFKEMVGSEVRSDNCGANSQTRKRTTTEVFTFDEYYDPHGGARPKHPSSNDSLIPDPVLLEPLNESVWSPLPTIPTPPQAHKFQFSQRCTVPPEYETLSCSVLNDNSHSKEDGNGLHDTVKVEQSRFDVSYNSDGEDWDGDIDYVGPECDPQTKSTHLSYSGIPKAVNNYEVLQTECTRQLHKGAIQDVQVASPPKNETEVKFVIPERDQSQNNILDSENENLCKLNSKVETGGQSKGIRFMSARSKFAAARKQFLSTRGSKLSQQREQNKADDKSLKEKKILPELNPNAENFTPHVIEVNTSFPQSNAPLQNTLKDVTNIVNYPSLDNQYSIEAISSELNYDYLSDAYKSMYGFSETSSTKVFCQDPSALNVTQICTQKSGYGNRLDESNKSSSVTISHQAYPSAVQLHSNGQIFPDQKCFETLQTVPESCSLNDNGTSSNDTTSNFQHASITLTQKSSIPDVTIPIGLPPHLVNAYMLFLKQQENSEAHPYVHIEEQSESFYSEPILPQAPVDVSANFEYVNPIQSEGETTDRVQPESVINYPKNTFANSFAPISRMSKANLLKQAALSSGNTKPAISELPQSNTSSIRVPTPVQLNDLGTEIIHGDAFTFKCSLQTNEDCQIVQSENLTPVDSHTMPGMNYPLQPMPGMKPPIQNGFCGNPPAMTYNPVPMQQSLPMIYPTFNPFLSPVAPFVPKVYKSQVFDHSVQQQKQQQNVQHQHPTDKNQQQLHNGPMESNNASVISNNHTTYHSISEKKGPISNKDRLKKKLECLNKVKSLMEEVRKDGGVINADQIKSVFRSND